MQFFNVFQNLKSEIYLKTYIILYNIHTNNFNTYILIFNLHKALSKQKYSIQSTRFAFLIHAHIWISFLCIKERCDKNNKIDNHAKLTIKLIHYIAIIDVHFKLFNSRRIFNRGRDLCDLDEYTKGLRSKFILF